MISDRIEALITHFCKGNKSLFAQQIGVTPSVIGNITGERKGNPSFEVIQKILDAFASVNPDWFILDRGSMLRDSKTSVDSQPDISPSEESIIYNMYKEEKAENKALIEEIGGLKERIRQLESQQPPESEHVHIPHGDVPPPHEGLGSSETVKSVHTKKHTSGSDHTFESTNLQTENP